jgi:porin
LKDFFRSIPRAPELRDLQGVELYYNAAITPWFHLTADLQFVRPGVSANDTAVVFGLRGKIDI